MNRMLHRLAAVAALGLMAWGCTENPVKPSEHAHADGVRVLLDGQPVVTVDDDGVEGEIVVPVGGVTPTVQVVLLDHDGEELEPAEGEYLEVVVEETEIATFEQEGKGEFAGRFHGHAEGATTAKLRLMHGAVGYGHVDAEWSVPVRVAGM